MNIIGTRTILSIVAASVVTTAISQEKISDSKGHTSYQIAITNPQVPERIEFAGQVIEFDRNDMYERMDRELTSMTYTHGNTLLLLKRANRYFPVVAPILKKNGVPVDLLYLACVESMLNPTAFSPAKAAGLWQFMSTTAKQYGLEVNEYVDERYNIEKATEAACRYLKKSYQEYGNWESAASSYNGGPTRITTELDAQMADSSFDLHLVEETSRYMFRILATKLIMENPTAYGFSLTSDQFYRPIEYKTVEVKGPVNDWVAWARRHHITYAQLREANPWIRAKTLPNKTGKTYIVKIPADKSLYRSTSTPSIYNPNWIRK